MTSVIKAASSATQTQKQYISIQVLRALAAILVVLEHAMVKIKTQYPENYTIFDQVLDKIGPFGVDIFFILSGLVMVLITRSEPNKINYIGTFLKKRVLRIYPIYWLALLTFIGLKMSSGLIAFDTYTVKQLLTSFFLLPTEINHEYFPILVVGWTLVFELCFYAIFALLLIFNLRTRLSLLVLFFVSTTAVGLFLNWQQPLTDPNLIYYLHPLTLEFVAGALIGYWFKQGKQLSLKHSGLLLLLTVLAITVIIIFKDVIMSENAFDRFRLFYFGLPAVLLVWVCVANERVFQNFVFKPIKVIGDSSYSLYLFHAALFLPMLDFVYKKFHIYGQIEPSFALAGLLGFSVLGSMVIYFTLEKPLVNKIHRLMKK